MTLDGSKTGLTVLPEVLKQDAKRYQKRAPAWKETAEDKERLLKNGDNELNLARPPTLGPFIMDTLHRQASKEGDLRLSAIEVAFASARHKIDTDLIAPWLAAKAIADRYEKEEKNTRMQNDLAKIEQHIQAIHAQHRAELGSAVGSQQKGHQNSPRRSDKGAAFTDLPIEVRQDKFRALSKEFSSLPSLDELLFPEEEVARLKASCAYYHDTVVVKTYRGWTRFPWDMAMRELGTIKARATGRHKTVAGEFYDDFNMKHPRKHHF